MSKFTFVELFAGIGGVSFGLKRVGGKCLLAAEFDPERRGKRQYVQEAYKILHPETPITGDVYELKSEDVPKCDVLSFTTPCQSFSVAGNRAGFEDVRGTVFFEAMRIAKDVQPKIILMENVKGIVNHDKGKTLDIIVRTANEVGYRVDFDVLNSKYFGVAQNRERFFMVGIREDLVPNEPWSEESTKGQTVVPKGKRRISAYEGVKTFNFDFPANDTVTTRLRDILETDVDEKYYLDEEKTEKLVAQLDDRETKDTPEMDMLGHVDIKGNDLIRRTYSTEGISPTLTTMGGGHREPKIAEEVRPVLTPDRMEKRQNGRRFKEDGEESFTLTSQDRHGVAIGNPPKYRIRKLTPLECWRLQGFPDEAHEAVKQAGISDSQRYKQAGNAVTVNVIEAIGERLIPLIN